MILKPFQIYRFIGFHINFLLITSSFKMINIWKKVFTILKMKKTRKFFKRILKMIPIFFFFHLLILFVSYLILEFEYSEVCHLHSNFLGKIVHKFDFPLHFSVFVRCIGVLSGMKILLPVTGFETGSCQSIRSQIIDSELPVALRDILGGSAKLFYSSISSIRYFSLILSKTLYKLPKFSIFFYKTRF